MRKYYRAIAKARMKACGVEKVNKKMAKMNGKGEELWRAFLWGEFAEQGKRAQLGRMRRKQRTLRKITPVTG